MTIENGIYSDDIQVYNYYMDPFGSARIGYYFVVLQEAAGSHAYACNAGLSHLQKEGKTWVVSRTKMTVSRYIGWPASFRVQTWAQEPYKFYCPRATQALDASGNELFCAMSHWAVVDLKTRRPLNPQGILARFEPKSAASGSPELGKRVSFNQHEFETMFTYQPTIHYNDMDLNGHVNNIVYLDWMLDSLPFSFRDAYKVSQIDISYLAETYRDDSILVYTGLFREDSLSAQEPQLVHCVFRLLADGGKETLSVAKTSWQKREFFVGIP